MSGEPVVRLTWLGHSSVVIDLGGMRLVTDPVLHSRAFMLSREAVPPSEGLWRRPDAVLLSHLHHDHADPASLRLFADVPVLTGPDNRSWVARQGLQVGPVGEGGWWSVPPSAGKAVHGRTRREGHAEVVGPVEVRLVRAVHGARPMPHRPNAASGFLVRGPRAVVYFAGDTELFDGMADLPAIAGRPVDVALLPIGGWGPRLSGGHLGPREAAEAASMVQARTVLPVHYGTLHPTGWPRRWRGWMHAPLPLFADALATTSPHTELLIAPPGTPVDIRSAG